VLACPVHGDAFEHWGGRTSFYQAPVVRRCSKADEGVGRGPGGPPHSGPGGPHHIRKLQRDDFRLQSRRRPLRGGRGAG
jgi:hypothetical protein